jgi:hypothetical protein
VQFTELTKKINSIFNAQHLLNSARNTQFLKRARQIAPMELLLSFIETLGVSQKLIWLISLGNIKKSAVCQ